MSEPEEGAVGGGFVDEKNGQPHQPPRTGAWENLGAYHGERAASQNNQFEARRFLPFSIGALMVFVLALEAFGVSGLGPFQIPALVILMWVLVRLVLRQRSEERSLGFFGRFIRPGLKKLLEEEGRTMIEGDKLFRGRKTVILKIDMVSYTKTTFDMPYGMRRLFQDLWFTLIDQVVAERVFLDKSLGDGSIYCLESPYPGGACLGALKCALEIRDTQIHFFDQVFQRRLKEQMEEEPGLAHAAKSYFERYEERMGHAFADRKTGIRMALVTGFVDEGLWGLSSQSHYDVLGAPVVLATRLEDQAEDGEIVMDESFLEELCGEAPALDRSWLESRRPTLKGIGPWSVYALPPSVSLSL